MVYQFELITKEKRQVLKEADFTSFQEVFKSPYFNLEEQQSFKFILIKRLDEIVGLVICEILNVAELAFREISISSNFQVSKGKILEELIDFVASEFQIHKINLEIELADRDLYHRLGFREKGEAKVEGKIELFLEVLTHAEYWEKHHFDDFDDMEFFDALENEKDFRENRQSEAEYERNKFISKTRNNLRGGDA